MPKMHALPNLSKSMHKILFFKKIKKSKILNEFENVPGVLSFRCPRDQKMYTLLFQYIIEML